MKDDKEFTEILEELAGEELLEEIEEDNKFETVTDDNVNDFVLEYGSKLVKDGMDSISKIKNKITSGQDADEIDALSQMMRAMNSTLDTLTKISLQNKKEKSATANKELDFNQRKELPDSPKTQVIVATREDIVKQILMAEREAKDVEVIEDE